MFERYTEQARRALFFARYEAFERGSPFIETEHVLLALFRDEQSLTARVFARAGLSLDGVRRQVKARTSQHAPLTESSEVPFSAGTKRVLQYAAQEADRLLHNHVGTEHVLLGLFREEQATAAAILRDLGLRISTVRDQIVESMSSFTSLELPLRMPFSPDEARSLRVSPSRRGAREGQQVVSTPHRVEAEGFTMKELLAWAYRTDVRQIDLPPGLDTSERYDARLDLPGSQSWPTIDRLVQDGIHRHFSITVTHEVKPIDVFALTSVERPSPGRRRHDDEPGWGTSMMYAGFSTVAFDTPA